MRNGNVELVRRIAALAEGNKKLRLMEVCGTHTVAIFRSGIRQVLPENVELVSGPGCPVCVTNDDYIDKAIEYTREGFIVATFGDMLKVPGSRSSLSEAQAAGGDVRIVYSPLDCVKLARENPSKKIIFLAVGFETTAPTAAATVLAAKAHGIKNLFMLSAQKLVPPALKFLLKDTSVKVDGFLLPGHVAVVIGADAFKFLAEDFKIPGAVGGFEAKEILIALKSLLEQIDSGRAEVVNDYRSVVKAEGNVAAKRILAQVYEVADAEWRGMGMIPESGLRMRDEFAAFDIERVEPVAIERTEKKTACRCGEVLRGLVKPTECPLFGKACQPLHAIGPCMVSVEGVCAAWFKYGGNNFKWREKF
ncbi:MAG: hydrogenase formation protein HypD [Selenomonadaceae bacterium]|nr:hydrogenase formation protein HypD [Selenomonadaceae bacterium]MBQ6757492.1 hydrogenase formation protein HypD [Selenomonadaceae bacterium]